MYVLTHNIVHEFRRLVGVLGLLLQTTLRDADLKWTNDVDVGGCLKSCHSALSYLSHRFVGILHEFVEARPRYIGRRSRSFSRQSGIVFIFVVFIPGGLWQWLEETKYFD